MKKYFSLIIIALMISSCWAPRCPITNCKAVNEHVHNDFVSGTFAPHSYFKPRPIHFIWDIKDNQQDADLETVQKSKKSRKKKPKKKLIWED